MNATREIPLTDGWQLARSPAGAIAAPEHLAGAGFQWHEAKVPGTVAAALHRDLDAPGDYDADDWWYRTTFALPPGCATSRQWLRFEGLATLAQVWLNGQPILDSRNMFVGHRVEVTRLLRDVNHLAIRFASLGAKLAEKRPRPRWRTALVESQNLRWFRTTLLGRMPGWTPPITPVGPWRPVVLECVEAIEVTGLNVQARAEGSTGRIQVRAAVARHDGGALEGARLRVGDTLHRLAILQGHDARIHGDVTIPDVPLWWPHTHGTPRRVRCALEVQVDGRWIAIDCGPIGFREVSVDQSDGRVRFLVNGVPVFCRGAVWTTMDFLSLQADPAALRRTLEQARDAGLNMLRVGGTMHYECDAFYRLCDELGILVWQDFMFANMDYPVADAQFRADAEAEVRHQLDRLHRRACIVAYCGGSEIAQQAAMMGLPADQWTNEFFTEALPRLCAGQHAGVPYFPSTPWGGALPFHVGSGIAHYYGVGAYRRPLSDLKTARVKFATECLGFSNIPEPETIEKIFHGNATPPPHHPKWKARQPRDNGAGWDFEDIRDHYLKLLFKVDAVELRSQDLPRYYALSRAVTGELMQRAYAEWRAPHSGCGGALVWLFRDLWPGAGWGITDSDGRPKAAFWHLKRAWAKRSVHLTDEGLDGLAVHAVNDMAQALEATLEIEMWREGRVATASAQVPLRIPARSAVSRHVDALVGYFSDSTNAYRFGPAKQDVVTARLRRADTGELLSEDFHFPLGHDLPPQRGAQVSTRVEWLADGRVALALRSDAFLQTVSLSSPGFEPDDNDFHLSPNLERRITFTALDPSRGAFKATLEALNLPDALTVRAQRGVAAHPANESGSETAGPRNSTTG